MSIAAPAARIFVNAAATSTGEPPGATMLTAGVDHRRGGGAERAHGGNPTATDPHVDLAAWVCRARRGIICRALARPRPDLHVLAEHPMTGIPLETSALPIAPPGVASPRREPRP